MKVISSPRAMTDWADDVIAAGGNIALVPTMGYFHQGHLSLMRRAKELADYCVVSLFVNPTQFGPNEDYSQYPRNLEQDSGKAAELGVDVLFTPSVENMYPGKNRTSVVVSGLTAGLCGASRPGHFQGVATVVAKLFNIVKPRYAVFGRKDFQQLAVIKQMVRDLNVGVEIVGHPIVREPDGLAMSSRNVYLSPSERQQALCLFKAIELARQEVSKGVRNAEVLIGNLHDFILAYDSAVIEYIKIVHQDDLTEQAMIDENSVLVLAVRIGRTRLIDNCLLR